MCVRACVCHLLSIEAQRGARNRIMRAREGIRGVDSLLLPLDHCHPISSIGKQAEASARAKMAATQYVEKRAEVMPASDGSDNSGKYARLIEFTGKQSVRNAPGAQLSLARSSASQQRQDTSMQVARYWHERRRPASIAFRTLVTSCNRHHKHRHHHQHHKRQQRDDCKLAAPVPSASLTQALLFVTLAFVCLVSLAPGE